MQRSFALCISFAPCSFHICKAHEDRNYPVAFAASYELLESHQARRIRLAVPQQLKVLKHLFESAWYWGDCWAATAPKTNDPIQKKCREACLEVVRYFVHACQHDAAFLQAVRAAGELYVRMTDYAVSLLPPVKSNVCIKAPGFARAFPHTLSALCTKEDGVRVFVFDSSYEITHRSFILSPNPIERPTWLTFQGCGYDHVLS